MSRTNLLVSGGLALLMGSALLAAKPSESSDTDHTAPHHGHARLIKPYSELTDLTEQEKTKITDIHQKAVDQIKEIEAKEKHEIEAVLTEKQKKELADIEVKDKEAARERRTHHSTTQPSGETETPTRTHSSK